LFKLGNFKTSGCLVGRPTCAPATTRLTPQPVGTSAITYNPSPYTFKGAPTAVVMCKYITPKGTQSNCNVRVGYFSFKGPPSTSLIYSASYSIWEIEAFFGG